MGEKPMDCQTELVAPDPMVGGEWALVEVLGHHRYAGYVREVSLYGVSFASIWIPELPPRKVRSYDGLRLYPAVPAWTYDVAGTSLYARTTVDEATARREAESLGHHRQGYELLTDTEPPRLTAEASTSVGEDGDDDHPRDPWDDDSEEDAE